MLRFLLFATWIAAASAQTADQSIAATALRTVSVPAEPAMLELRASTPAATTLAQLLPDYAAGRSAAEVRRERAAVRL
jgi:hypothetical protein